MSARGSFWSIPPIQDAITSNLSREDLTHCLRVSKTFARFSIPSLYREVELRGRYSQKLFFDSPSLDKNRIFLKSLTAIQSSHLGSDPRDGSVVTFPNLVSLTVGRYVAVDGRTEQLIQFVERHSLLRSFKGMGLNPSENCIQKLSVLLERHGKLQDVDLDFNGTPTGGKIVRILQSSTRLSSLRLRTTGGMYARFSSNDLAFQDSSLQEFELYPRLPWLEEAVLLFLRHCPKLKRLSLGADIESESGARGLLRLLTKHCPRLQDLALITSGQIDYAHVVIRGLSNLRQLAVALPQKHDEIILSIFLHRHSLTALDLRLGNKISLQGFNTLTRECPVLWDLKATLSLNEDLSQEQKPCVCTRLETLQLSVSSYGPAKETVAMRLGMMYARIGELAGLKELSLDCSSFLKGLLQESFYGGLQCMLGLLRIQSFGYHDYSRMDYLQRRDIEQMLDCWPGLGELGFEVYPACLQEDAGFLAEVRERRGWLRINGNYVGV